MYCNNTSDRCTCQNFDDLSLNYRNGTNENDG